MICYKIGGFAIYDGKEFAIFKQKNSGLPTERFYSIASDKNNIIWAGTFIEGVVRFDGKDLEI